MAKRKRTDPAKENSGPAERGEHPVEPANDTLDQRHLNKTSRGNESDEVESRHLARSRSRNNDGTSRLWGYKSGDGPAPGMSNKELSIQGSDDRKLNGDQSFEESSTTTGKRLETDDDPEEPQN